METVGLLSNFEDGDVLPADGGVSCSSFKTVNTGGGGRGIVGGEDLGDGGVLIVGGGGKGILGGGGMFRPGRFTF